VPVRTRYTAMTTCMASIKAGCAAGENGHGAKQCTDQQCNVGGHRGCIPVTRVLGELHSRQGQHLQGSRCTSAKWAAG
jgi:hypothetical protein